LIFMVGFHFSSQAFSQIIISEVDPNSATVEFKNVGSQPLNMIPYTFRSGQYGLIGIDRVLVPDELIVYSFPPLKNKNDFGEFSIYLTDQYNAANFIDYLIWSDRDTTTQAMMFAVQAGVWDGLDKYLPAVPFGDPFTEQNYVSLAQMNFTARGGHETNSQTWGLAANSYYLDAFCDSLSFGLNDRVLVEESNGHFDYEAESLIQSDQLITSISQVDYDSSVGILLELGFEIEQGAIFEAFIDGCNVGLGGIHE